MFTTWKNINQTSSFKICLFGLDNNVYYSGSLADSSDMPSNGWTVLSCPQQHSFNDCQHFLVRKHLTWRRYRVDVAMKI